MKKVYKDDSLPLYEFVIDEDNVQSLSRISVVGDPAIEMKGFCFSKEEEVKYQFFADEEKQIIAGPAMIPNKKIKRLDEDGNPYMGFFSVDTIQKMVSIFNKNIQNRPSGVINDDHTDKMVDAFIIGNWIVGDSYYDKSRTYGFDLPVGTFFVECKVDDKQFWKDQVKGEGKFGFSIEGIMGTRPTEFSKVSDEDEWMDVLNEIGWIKMDKKFKDLIKKI